MKVTPCIVCTDIKSHEAPRFFIVSSADAFCGAEHRKLYCLQRGCQLCGMPYDENKERPTGKWKLGSFLSYSDVTVQCPRCIKVYPLYLKWLKGIRKYNDEIKSQLGNLYAENIPENIYVNGENVFYDFGHSCDNTLLSLEDLQKGIKALKKFDLVKYQTNEEIKNREIKKLRRKLKQELRYVDWLNNLPDRRKHGKN